MSPKGSHNFSAGKLKIISNVKMYLEKLHVQLKTFCREHNVKQDTLLASLKNSHSATAEACGVSKSTVLKSISQNSNNCENAEGPRRGRKEIVCDDFTKSVIRNTCYQMYADKLYPAIESIRLKCLEDENFPRVKRETFRKWMLKKCKFRYHRLFKKPVFLERTDILAQRDYYLRHIRHYRETKYKIYYCDETWTSPNQSRNRCWQVLLNNTEIQEFKQLWSRKVLQNVDGWTGGFIVKGGQGRVIVNHIGSDDGFLAGAQDVFLSMKDTQDYHNSMNGEHYADWFNKVLELIPNHSVIVLDQAPYHRNRVPGTVMPKMYWKKQSIIQWMYDHNIPLPDGVDDFGNLTKASLIELSMKYPVEERFVIEDILRDSGKDVEILWLPVAHCELNPIELIWAFVKYKASTLNTIGGSKNVLNVTLESLKLLTPELWAGCVREAIRYEDKFWVRDRMIEQNLTEERVSNPNLVINLNEQSDSSDFSSSSSLLQDTDSE